MRIAIINGPNLNLTGRREQSIYGTQSFEDVLPIWRDKFAAHELVYYQSNHEGDLIDWLQDEGCKSDGIVLNAGGYTHTSIAIRDAIAAIKAPVIEVHISDITQRESFRTHSMISDVCKQTIMGKGIKGYELAITQLTK